MLIPQWGNSAFKYIVRENQTAYDHIFYEFVKHVCCHVTTPLILCIVVDSTPYHDWGAMVTAQRLDTYIYWSLLPAVHMSTTITVKRREVRLITKDYNASNA